MKNILDKILEMKAEFEMKNGFKPTQIKIGSKAMDALVHETGAKVYGTITDIYGMTPILSGTDWELEVLE